MFTAATGFYGPSRGLLERPWRGSLGGGSLCMKSSPDAANSDVLFLCPTLHVSDIERSSNFYCSILGMDVISPRLPDGSTLIGYKTQSDCNIKLLKSTKSICHGDGGFLGIGIESIYAAKIFRKAKKQGVPIITKLGDFAYGASLFPDEDEEAQTPVRYGRLTDPDGYPIEVSEPLQSGIFDSVTSVSRDKKKEMECRIKKLTLGVVELDESVDFYTSLGLQQLLRRSNVFSLPREASMVAWVGVGVGVGGDSRPTNNPATAIAPVFLELFYKYATPDKVDVGTGLVHLEIKTRDMPRINANITVDPNGIPLQPHHGKRIARPRYTQPISDATAGEGATRGVIRFTSEEKKRAAELVLDRVGSRQYPTVKASIRAYLNEPGALTMYAITLKKWVRILRFWREGLEEVDHLPRSFSANARTIAGKYFKALQAGFSGTQEEYASRNGINYRSLKAYLGQFREECKEMGVMPPDGDKQWAKAKAKDRDRDRDNLK